MNTGMFYPGPWVAGGTERHLLAMASVISRRTPVEILTFVPARWDELGRRLNLDLSAVRFRAIPEAAADALMDSTKAYDLWIDGSPWDIVPSHCPNSMFLVVYPPPMGSSPAYHLRRTIALALKSIAKRTDFEHALWRLTPTLGRRLRLLSAVSPRRALDTYRLILANSEFTRALIQRRWRRESVVLYPPIDTESFRPLPKRRWILSVGRFGHGGNNKKHLVLIDAFQRLVGRGLSGWELHLAGSTHEAVKDRAYFEGVERAASGLPVVIHADCDHEELRELYGRSVIYWHGAGYRKDGEQNPLAVEHFGITTVEAMAAGCIPVVCGKGGQPEIVEHGVNGFLWNTTDELESFTLCAVDRWMTSDQLCLDAVARSRLFGMERFAARLLEILDGLDHPSPASCRYH